MALTVETVYQRGLLSTPFHRVYFADDDSLPDIERLPMMRVKLPIGVRANYFANDWLVLRGGYRFYVDNFGIFAQTLTLDVPLKVGSFFSLYPFYRFHFQTASRYFAPYASHRIGSTFHTSDYDLSGFSSHKVGLGLSYSPLNGMFSMNISPRGKKARFQSLDARGGYYWRSDGLRAWTASLGIGIQI